MSMADFAAALQGGGAPPGPPGGPPPGALGGGDPGSPADAGALPPDAGAVPADGGNGGGELFQNSLEALDVAEEALHSFIRLDPDDTDRAQAGQALNIVLKLKASNQKSTQAGDAKSLSRALSVGGPPSAGGPPSGPSGLGALGG